MPELEFVAAAHDDPAVSHFFFHELGRTRGAFRLGARTETPGQSLRRLTRADPNLPSARSFCMAKAS